MGRRVLLMSFHFVSRAIRLRLLAELEVVRVLTIVVKAYKSFNQVLLAIELDGVTWDFGQFLDNCFGIMS